MDVRNKAALVTGASRGLGAAVARVLARRGARVVLVARGEEALRSVVEQIRAEGGDAHALRADVGDKHAALPIAASAAALVGSIDLCVHNASTLGPLPMPLLLDTRCEDLAAVLETNLIGPFRISKAVAGSMALRGGGLIVHVTSDASVEAYPRWGAYGVSKAAFDHLARIWAAELAELGVRMISIDPGEMDTQMHADAVPDADRSALANPAQVAERVADIIARSAGLQPGARLRAADSTEQAA
jgi:NAD(P)-dependent dehydrogenase (short-subunit alcohol dehydrogenase family)